MCLSNVWVVTGRTCSGKVLRNYSVEFELTVYLTDIEFGKEDNFLKFELSVNFELTMVELTVSAYLYVKIACRLSTYLSNFYLFKYVRLRDFH